MNYLDLPAPTRSNKHRKPTIAPQCPPLLCAVAAALVGFYAIALAALLF